MKRRAIAIISGNTLEVKALPALVWLGEAVALDCNEEDKDESELAAEAEAEERADEIEEWTDELAWELDWELVEVADEWLELAESLYT